MENQNLNILNRIIRLKTWRNQVNSTNVRRLRYDDDIQRLIIEFQGGGTYTYFDVPFDMYWNVAMGNAATRTAGPWGPVGKTPSNGAAVHQYLIDQNVRYEKGGDLF